MLLKHNINAVSLTGIFIISQVLLGLLIWNNYIILINWHVYITYICVTALLALFYNYYNKSVLLALTCFCLFFWYDIISINVTLDINFFSIDYASFLNDFLTLMIHLYVDFVKFLNGWEVYNDNSIVIKKKSVHISELTSTLISSNSTNYTLLKHNDHVFTYFQTNARIFNIAHHYSENYKIFVKIVALNTKCGYKQKSLNTLHYALAYVYDHFNTFDTNLNKEYTTYTTFYNFSKTFTNEFYKPDFLIKFVYLYLELLFLIKRVKPKKKLKKKKLQSKSLVSYLPNKARYNITVRLINAYINNSTTHSKTERMGDALMYLILSGKNSFLYRKKITMYNKLLEKKKFY